MDIQETQQTPQPGATPAVPQQQTTQQVTPAQPQDGVRELSDGRVQVLSHKAYKDIREKSRTQGRQAALQEVEAKAKELGFSSAEEMYAHAALAKQRNSNGGGNGQRNGNQERNGNGNGQRRQVQQAQADVDVDAPNAAPSPPPQGASRGQWARYEREKARWQTEKNTYQRRLQSEAQQRRSLRQELDRTQVEMSLRETAVRKGVQEVDYAVHLLRKEISGKTEAELNSFDEGKWFDNLRTEKPYLFGELVRPATTGTAGAAAPNPPNARQVTANGVNGTKVDVRQMSPKEYKEYLKSKGLSTQGM